MKKEITEDEEVGAEIERLFGEVDVFEYNSVLYEHEITELKGKYWDLLMRLDRTVLSEDERRELDAHAERVHVDIQRTEQKLQKLRESFANIRGRLDAVHVAHEDKRRRQIDHKDE